MSDSSLVEVEACLEISLDLKYISKEDFELLGKSRRELAVILISFINKVQANL